MTIPSVETLVLVSGILLIAGVMASKLSDRLGVPALLLFLVIGMVAGSEGIGGIEFESAEIAQALGTVALLVILFAGGLDTAWSEVKPVLAQGLLLSTVGVVSTTLLLGAFAWFMLGDYSTFDVGRTGVTWTQALLLAAIVSSTDAAAVFSVFRTSGTQPVPRVRYLLEFESGSNDPMAVLLTTMILGIMTQAAGSASEIVVKLILQFVLGGLVGLGVGFVGVSLVNRVRLSTVGLFPILVLSIALLSFGTQPLIPVVEIP